LLRFGVGIVILPIEDLDSSNLAEAQILLVDVSTDASIVLVRLLSRYRKSKEDGLLSVKQHWPSCSVSPFVCRVLSTPRYKLLLGFACSTRSSTT
jgi:hypothetical protein